MLVRALLALLLCIAPISVPAATFETPEGLTIAYSDSGSGTPLLLIHAFPTDQRLWTAQQPLQSAFRVITLDLQGFGHSAPTQGDAVSMASHAEAVYALLEHLKLKRAIIGGESMGGYVALAFLEKYPDATAGLILSGTQSTADTPETAAIREKTAQSLLKSGTDTFVEQFLAKALSPAADDTTRAFLRTILTSQAATGMASSLRGMAIRTDTSATLAKTRVPVLILTGSIDAVIPPAQSERLHALVPESRLIILQDAGHLASLEQPARWNAAVADMFAGMRDTAG